MLSERAKREMERWPKERTLRHLREDHARRVAGYSPVGWLRSMHVDAHAEHQDWCNHDHPVCPLCEAMILPGEARDLSGKGHAECVEDYRAQAERDRALMEAQPLIDGPTMEEHLRSAGIGDP